ncbi:MAG: glycosyltransferase family 4 protein [Candidatus Dormibacteraeota bacterium]|nr:glycosyltransferase family 4 protein [Candidatus Dormibacteraeota bacterium]
MTFPDRNQGGSGVYARSLVAALRGRDDVEVNEIRAGRPGLGRMAWWLARGAARQVRDSRSELLHCPNFVTPWAVKVPVVVTIFDLSTRRFPRDHPLEWRVYERQALPSRVRRAARVIAISEVSRKDVIREYGVRPERVATVYPGVDPRFFTAADASGKRLRTKPSILFPGAPVARKNLDLVLRAMAAAPPDSALGRAALQISGASAERFPEHTGRIQALRLSNRVEWLGQVSAEAMPGVMAGADVCVYPSLYEGFGFPPLEAMASGTPVVSSNASCLPEILDDAALLIDPSDVTAFGKAVQSMLTDQDLRARMIATGRRHAEAFTWERCAQGTFDVYHEALAQGSA